MRTALTIPFVLALAAASVSAQAGLGATDLDVQGLNLMDKITALNARDDLPELAERAAIDKKKSSSSVKHKTTTKAKPKATSTKAAVTTKAALKAVHNAQVLPPAPVAATTSTTSAEVVIGTQIVAAAVNPVAPTTTSVEYGEAVAAAANVPAGADASAPASEDDASASTVAAAPVDTVVPSPVYQPVVGPNSSTYHIGAGFDRPTPTFVPHLPPGVHKRYEKLHDHDPEDEVPHLKERDTWVLATGSNEVASPAVHKAKKPKASKASAQASAKVTAKNNRQQVASPASLDAAATTTAAVVVVADTSVGAAAAIAPTPTVLVGLIAGDAAQLSVEANDSASSSSSSDAAAATPDSAATTLVDAANIVPSPVYQPVVGPNSSTYKIGGGFDRPTPTFVPHLPPGVHKRMERLQRRH